MRILLIDDEPLLLKSYSRYLSIFMGHEVVAAGSGAEGLALLEEDGGFDVIFCDVSMRGISGLDVHRAVCDHHFEMSNRFVFLTGGTTDQDAEDYIRRSGVLVLGKPVKQEAFEKALAVASSA